MEAYIRGLIPNLAQLRDMPTQFVQMYCRIAARKFFFFCDPHRRGIKKGTDLYNGFTSKTAYKINFLGHILPFILAGKACIKKVLLSNCLQELMELHQVIFFFLLFNVVNLTSYSQFCYIFHMIFGICIPQ